MTATDLRNENAANSPLLLADPDDARFVVAAHRMDAPDFSCGLHVSGDGGRGWIPVQPVPKLPAGAEKCYAPEVAFDGRGTLYYLFVGLHGSGNEPMGAFLTSSSDRGRSWTPPQQVLGPENYQVRLAIDPSRGERGRIHLVWLRSGADAPLGGLPPADNPIVAAHSDDGGRTFSEPVRVSDPERTRAVAPGVALAEDGTLSVAYWDLQDDAVDYQGLDGPPWADTWSLVVSTSTDGGAHFGRGAVVDDELVPPGRVMLIFTMPPPSLVADGDRLYAGWWDSRRKDADVYVARSEDRGRTWSEPVLVNDDRVDHPADQHLVRLGVAPGGRLDAVFFDRRNDAQNLYNDVYYSYSTDGGRRFATNVRLTAHPSDSRIGQGYAVRSAKGLTEFGSRLGLLSLDRAAIAAWPDTRWAELGGKQQDLLATEIRFPAEDGGFPLTIVLIGAVFVAGVAALLVMRRSRVDAA